MFFHFFHDRTRKLYAFGIGVREELFNHPTAAPHHVLDGGEVAFRDTTTKLRMPEKVTQVKQKVVVRVLSIS